MAINKIISKFFYEKKKSQYKNFFIIFTLLTRIYSTLIGFLEDIFYKNKKFKDSFSAFGVFKFELEFNANSFIKKAKKIRMDDALSIYCLKKEDVNKLIKKVFDEKTQSLIYKKTGFVYSVDYLRIYENNHISEANNQFKIIREAHYDKAFSRNMLKIFIPLNVDLDSGPLKVSSVNSTELNQEYEIDSTNCTYVTGSGELIYGILPNLCWHQEGNPQLESSSKQIMFQLNPSNRWEFRKDVYLRQIKTENKFSSFSSLFYKKQRIN